MALFRIKHNEFEQTFNFDQFDTMHLNEWNEDDFNNFEKFIQENSKKIITYDYALKKINNNFFFKFINKLTEKILRFKRTIGSNPATRLKKFDEK